MRGYQLSLYTQMGRSHHGQELGEWLLKKVQALGIGGATLTAASGGYGRDGRFHAAHFFELGEQPLALTMALSEAQAEQLFASLAAEGLQIFYTKTPIEYGLTGEKTKNDESVTASRESSPGK